VGYESLTHNPALPFVGFRQFASDVGLVWKCPPQLAKLKDLKTTNNTAYLRNEHLQLNEKKR
jgi:hypothetical protein